MTKLKVKELKVKELRVKGLRVKELKVQRSYEEGNLEDADSDSDFDSDGNRYHAGRNQLHGLRVQPLTAEKKGTALKENRPFFVIQRHTPTLQIGDCNATLLIFR